MRLYKIKNLGKRGVLKLIQLFRFHWIARDMVVYIPEYEIDIEPFLAMMGDNAVLLNECDYTRLERVPILSSERKFELFWNEYTLRRPNGAVIVRSLIFEDAEKLVKFFDKKNYIPRYGFYDWNPEDLFENNLERYEKYIK